MKAGLRKVISRPLISPVKSPRRRNSTGPTAAKVIRPATRPGVRLSKNPSWTHRPLLNFCATRSIRNELPLVLLDPDPLAGLELLHVFLLKQLQVPFDPERIAPYLKLFAKEDGKKLQTARGVWIEEDEWKHSPA